MSVFGHVRVVRRDAPGQTFGSARQTLPGKSCRDRGRGKTKHTVGHGDVEDASFARAFAFRESRKDRDHAPHAATDVGELKTRRLRRSILRPHGTEKAASREVIDVVTGTMRKFACLSVTGQRADDEARILGSQSIVTEAQAIQYAGTKLFEEYVVGAEQLFEGRASFGSFEVQQGPAFASVQEVKRSGHQVTQVVTGAEVLEFVHGRSEIREDERREGAGQKTRKVEDSFAYQRTHDGLTSKRVREWIRKGRPPTRNDGKAGLGFGTKNDQSVKSF